MWFYKVKMKTIQILFFAAVLALGIKGLTHLDSGLVITNSDTDPKEEAQVTEKNVGVVGSIDASLNLGATEEVGEVVEEEEEQTVTRGRGWKGARRTGGRLERGDSSDETYKIKKLVFVPNVKSKDLTSPEAIEARKKAIEARRQKLEAEKNAKIEAARIAAEKEAERIAEEARLEQEKAQHETQKPLVTGPLADYITNMMDAKVQEEIKHHADIQATPVPDLPVVHEEPASEIQPNKQVKRYRKLVLLEKMDCKDCLKDYFLKKRADAKKSQKEDL